MSGDEFEGVGDDIHEIVQYALSPEAIFRRNSAKRMVKELHRRYGDPILLDLLVAVDSMDVMASVIVLERSEIDNYVFSKYGIYDEDMFLKIQMTDSWDDFMVKLIGMSGQAAVNAVAEVLVNEGIAENDHPE